MFPGKAKIYIPTCLDLPTRYRRRLPANNVQECINREMGSVIADGTGLPERRVHAVPDGRRMCRAGRGLVERRRISHGSMRRFSKLHAPDSAKSEALNRGA